VIFPEQVATWRTEATGAPPEGGVEFFGCADSLAAVKLLHQVNESFGAPITITEFVGHHADYAPVVLRLRRARCTV
jgi:hypothetical protein